MGNETKKNDCGIYEIYRYHPQVYTNTLGHIVYAITNPSESVIKMFSSGSIKNNATLSLMTKVNVIEHYHVVSLRLSTNLITNTSLLELIVSKQPLVTNKPDPDLDAPLGGDGRIARSMRRKMNKL